MNRTQLIISIAAGMLVAASASRGWPQTTGGLLPPLVIASMSGADLYAFYCASCHGTTGRGDGPTAPALKATMPDLTTLAARSQGRYPAARVTDLVTHGEGLPTPAHGSKEMPVWGPVFRALDPSDTRNKVRIANIVEYVGTLQGR